MRRTIYLNRKHALKAPIQDSVLNKCSVLRKVTSVTKDCKIIGVESNTCWFLFVPTFPVTKNKKEKRPPKMKQAETRLFFFIWPFKQTQQLCTCRTLFTFLCRHYTSSTWKCLISCFVEDGEMFKRWRNFLSLSNFDVVLRNLTQGKFAYIWQSKLE